MLKVIIVFFAFTLILALEAAVCVFWFVKKYLGSRHMKFSQFKKQTKRLVELHRIKKSENLPKSALTRFLEDNKEAYLSVFASVKITIGGSVIFLVTFTICFALMQYSSYNMGVITSVFMLILFIGCNATLWQIFWGQGADFNCAMNAYLRFLHNLRAYDDEIDSLLDSKANTNQTKKSIKKSCSNKQPKDGAIKGNSQTPKKATPFDIILFCVQLLTGLALMGMLMYYSISQINLQMTDKQPCLLGRDEFVLPVGLLLILLFLITLYIQDKNNFDFLKPIFQRIRVFFFGAADVSVNVGKGIKDIWGKRAEKMCKSLNVKALDIELTHNSQNVACVYLNKAGRNIILVDGFIMQAMKQYFDGKGYTDFEDAVMFIIGHEIAHAHFKDTDRLKGSSKEFLISFMTALGIFFIAARLIWVTSIIPMTEQTKEIIIFSLAIVCVLVTVFISFPLCEVRYWAQVKELRADRYSIFELKLDKSVFAHVADFFRYIGVDGQDEAHPTIELRQKEIEKHGAWQKSDYIRYAIRYRINRMLFRKSIL